MAHLPLALRQEPPESALVICFGMGTTFRSLMSWGIEVTAVELVKSVPEAFPYYHRSAEEILQDPRGRIVIDDGRRFLQRVDKKYDVITIDASPPIAAAGASLLYSGEFYELVKRRLNPDGIVHHWFGSFDKLVLNAVARSLRDAFTHVRVFQAYGGWGYHFIASREPIAIPPADEFVARFPDADRNDLVEWNRGMNRDAKAFAAHLLEKEVEVEPLLHSDPKVRITDDRPLNEYYLLRRGIW
jgi:spermidine synthase